MTTIITTCRACGQEFEPAHDAIVRGDWQRCPACQSAVAIEQPETETATHCQECGRTLRAGTRSLCLGCLTGGGAV